MSDQATVAERDQLIAWVLELYVPGGAVLWLADAIRKGWTLEECLRQADILRSGAFS